MSDKLRNFDKFKAGHYYVCTNMIPEILKCMNLSEEDEEEKSL